LAGVVWLVLTVILKKITIDWNPLAASTELNVLTCYFLTLQRHLRVHIVEKPNSFSQCTELFICRNNLEEFLYWVNLSSSENCYFSPLKFHSKATFCNFTISFLHVNLLCKFNDESPHYLGAHSEEKFLQLLPMEKR
jgi:hypothetical protein